MGDPRTNSGVRRVGGSWNGGAYCVSKVQGLDILLPAGPGVASPQSGEVGSGVTTPPPGFWPSHYRDTTSPAIEPAHLESPVEESIYVVSDSANLFSGAQLIDGKRNMEIKVNLATILPLIDENRPIKHRVVVASFPERSNRMWRYFEQRRYHIIYKPEEAQVAAELAAQIRAFVAREANPHTSLLVFVTGDGNAHAGQQNFPELLTAALQRGWSVELVCWRSCLNPVYETLSNDYPRTMRLRFLDSHRADITFFKPRMFSGGSQATASPDRHQQQMQGGRGGLPMGLSSATRGQPYHVPQGLVRPLTRAVELSDSPANYYPIVNFTGQQQAAMRTLAEQQQMQRQQQHQQQQQQQQHHQALLQQQEQQLRMLAQVQAQAQMNSRAHHHHHHSHGGMQGGIQALAANLGSMRLGGGHQGGNGASPVPSSSACGSPSWSTTPTTAAPSSAPASSSASPAYKQTGLPATPVGMRGMLYGGGGGMAQGQQFQQLHPHQPQARTPQPRTDVWAPEPQRERSGSDPARSDIGRTGAYGQHQHFSRSSSPGDLRTAHSQSPPPHASSPGSHEGPPLLQVEPTWPRSDRGGWTSFDGLAGGNLLQPTVSRSGIPHAPPRRLYSDSCIPMGLQDEVLKNRLSDSCITLGLDDSLVTTPLSQQSPQHLHDSSWPRSGSTSTASSPSVLSHGGGPIRSPSPYSGDSEKGMWTAASEKAFAQEQYSSVGVYWGAGGANSGGRGESGKNRSDDGFFGGDFLETIE